MSAMIDRLAREAADKCSHMEEYLGACVPCLTDALRAFQAEAAKVAREWQCSVEYGVSYRCGAKSAEIAAKIEAL